MFVPPLKGSPLVINGLGLYGLVAMVAGIRMYRPRAQLAWWLFVLGVFLFWVGDVYTYSIRILFDVSVPFPSFGGCRLPDHVPGADGRHHAPGPPP